MVYSTKQLGDLKKERIKWLKQTMEISKTLYDEIAEQKKKQKESYLKILEHVWKIHSAKLGDRPSLLSEAKAEAENYVNADRICIALEEIDKQCQKIGTDVPFGIDPERKLTTLDEPGRDAVAKVVYASEYCKKELPKKAVVKKTLENVSNLLGKFWGDLQLEAQPKAKRMTWGDIIKIFGKTEVAPAEIVEKVAEVNHLEIK